MSELFWTYWPASGALLLAMAMGVLAGVVEDMRNR